MRRNCGIVCLIMFLLSACSATTPDRTTTTIPDLTTTAERANPMTPAVPAPTPVFINHKKPDVRLDVTAFDKASCPSDEFGFRKCKEDSPLYALGCDFIKEPSDLLGALRPVYPIMLCETDHWSLIRERKDIDERLWNRCDTAPQEVCTSIEEIIGQRCERTHSGFCESYRQVLIKKCNDPSANVCDPLDGVAAVFDEAYDKTFGDVEHLSGGYAYNPAGTYFFSQGGLMITYYRYVIFQDNHFVLIKTEDEFRRMFAPLESPEEALAYVKAATGHIELYDLKYDPRLEYFVDIIEDTHAEQVADGYLVNLFIRNLECTTATTSVKFHVTRDGRITQRPELPRIFKERSRNGECRVE